MRVVGGRCKGVRLASFRGRSIRPTSDKVREAVFNILANMLDLGSVGKVLDLFAGTGAMGIEALSRGAAGAVFGYYHVSFYPQFAFSPLWTFDALLITFLGGVGTLWGPVLGAAFFLPLREVLALQPRLVEVHLLIFGILFILIVVALPGGFVEACRSVAAHRQRLREGHAA